MDLNDELRPGCRENPGGSPPSQRQPQDDPATEAKGSKKYTHSKEKAMQKKEMPEFMNKWKHWKDPEIACWEIGTVSTNTSSLYAGMRNRPKVERRRSEMNTTFDTILRLTAEFKATERKRKDWNWKEPKRAEEQC